MKIAVGISGGVDSSVAALLLKEAGHEVYGIMMKIWKGKPLVQSDKHACYGSNEEEEIEMGQKVCKTLGIPFFLFDCAEEYQKIVLTYFKTEYLKGMTPNPCIICNQKIKFDVLPVVAKRNITFDKFATGHYARIQYNQVLNRYLLMKAIDAKKDQSYFLYRLSQPQLASSLFPLGELTKEQVREIAKKNSLPTSEEEESQDFYSGDYQELLGVATKTGNIVDIEGNILGQHKGYWNFTIGQRKGLCISSHHPLYVIRIDQEKNQVVVGTKKEGSRSNFWIVNMNWISQEGITENTKASVKSRSTQNGKPCLVSPTNQLSKVLLTLDFEESGISPGQSAVLYQDDLVLGGGFIQFAEE